VTIFIQVSSGTPNRGTALAAANGRKSHRLSSLATLTVRSGSAEAVQQAKLKRRFCGDCEGGLKSADDPAFKRSFIDVYHAASLQVPWYAVLGNRDYNDDSTCTIADPGCTYSPLHQVNLRPGHSAFLTAGFSSRELHSVTSEGDGNVREGVGLHARSFMESMTSPRSVAAALTRIQRCTSVAARHRAGAEG
jgi:hypothetical protein